MFCCACQTVILLPSGSGRTGSQSLAVGLPPQRMPHVLYSALHQSAGPRSVQTPKSSSKPCGLCAVLTPVCRLHLGRIDGEGRGRVLGDGDGDRRQGHEEGVLAHCESLFGREKRMMGKMNSTNVGRCSTAGTWKIEMRRSHFSRFVFVAGNGGRKN